MCFQNRFFLPGLFFFLRKINRVLIGQPHIYRRLGVKPGNLNGSCVRDPVAGDYFVISAPGARARARAGRALGVGA